MTKMFIQTLTQVACERALRGALAAGRKKEGELATKSLEFQFRLQFPCGSPRRRLSCQIFANQREAGTNANVNKH